jgi:dTDP-4-amino-4,6-dideoxygalactose transaminase
MREDFLVFGSPLIEQPETDEVVSSLKSGWLGTGPRFTNLRKCSRNVRGQNTQWL